MNGGLLGGLGAQPLKTQRMFSTAYGATIIIPPNAAATSTAATVDTPGFQIKDGAVNRRAFYIPPDSAGTRSIIFQSRLSPVGAITWQGFDRTSTLFFNTYIGTNVYFSSLYYSSTTIGGLRFQASNGNGTVNHFSLWDDGQTTANVMAQRNGTNAQAFRVYNTFTSVTDYERFNIDWQTTPGTCVIGTSVAGSGVARGIHFRVGDTTLISLPSSGGVINIGSTAAGSLVCSGSTITGAFGGSTSGRPVLSLAAGSGSSIFATVGGIVGTDCFGVAPAGGAASVNMFGVISSNTAFTVTIGAARKDYNGAYTGAGHTTSIIGGRGSSVTTGGAGGALTLTGGDAAGSGNNNGGNVTITGGAATGTGNRGAIIVGTSTTDRLTFWGGTPVTRGVLATGAHLRVDDVIAYLQNLNLCSQS